MVGERKVEKGIIKSINGGRVAINSELSLMLKISQGTIGRYILELVISGDVQKLKKTGTNL